MAERRNIFAKARLKPSQLRAVAERRFGDARCLLDSGIAERVNGSIYMAGFVIECLLKAILLDRHPNLQGPVDPAKLSVSDREAFRLLYSHDLDDMVEFLPEVESKLFGLRTKSGELVMTFFRSICEEWTVFARYSTVSAKVEDGESYLETVNEVRKWLKEL